MPVRQLRALIVRLGHTFGRKAQGRELAEELESHLQLHIEDNVRAGLTPQEARRQALIKLGGIEQTKELYRRQWGLPGIESFIQDARFGTRMLLKNPGFTVVSVIALALGIGANSAIFSVVNTVLLRPLPYPDPDQLVMVWEDDTKGGYPRDTPAAANYIDWRDQNGVFEGMAAVAEQNFNLTGKGEPERLEGRRVSTNLFSLLGVEPRVGRAFLTEEDQPGRNRVVIMSHGLWQRRFGSNVNIVGQTLTLNGESYVVVGVMPSHFQFPSREDELWVPIAFTPQEAVNREKHYLEVVARIKPGVTLEQARAEMRTIAARLQQQFPEQNANLGAAVTPLHEQVVGDIKPVLLVLLGAVGFVLLIACANVANLLLARAAVRQKEITIRVALGASRWRLIRQFLTESMLLAVLGGGGGLLLSLWGVSLLKAFIPESVSQVGDMMIDGRVLLFTVLISLLTGLIFGLAPVMQWSKLNLNETLKEGGRDSATGSRGNRIRSLLVITEVAVSLILLIGAALLINSFLRLRNIDPGFRPENLLTMRVELPDVKYPDHRRRAAFYNELLGRLETLPGVKSAAVTTNLPLYRQGNSTEISIEGRPDPAPGQGKRPSVTTRVISPHYFQTMGIGLLQGRGFSEQDKIDSPAVAVISETMARRFWPNQDPTGKRFTPGSLTSTDPGDWITVVGVAKDVRQFELVADPKPQMYLPYVQAEFFAPNDLVISTDLEPLSLAASVRRTVLEVDKDQPISDIRTMEDIVSESVARQRFSMLLLGIFAALALVLAAVGIYGVMSYSVAQRTREFGIRMALGARRSDVLRLAVGQGVKLVLIGIAIGLGAAFILTRVMSSLLFGVSATDPLTFITISLVLTGVAALASFIPARRATKIDPMLALRHS
ncbi:MAG TPA: ABC transporter permease [Pyrinomonadaceae bacterium]|jgi:putative ABC transport system permease protein